MNKKRNIIQSINKDILKGFKRLYWYTYTASKYNYLSFKFKIIKKKKNNYKISPLCPTRERSLKFKRLLESLITKCFDLSRIELLILLDEDDKEIDEYNKIIKDSDFKISKFIKNLKTHAERNNYLASKSTGQILFPINDDMIFISNKWDLSIDEEFSKVSDSVPYCLWIDSGKKYRYLHCDFPIINKLWYEKLGYVGSEHFNFWYLDTWICDLSFRSKKFIVSNKIEVSQLSANTYENEVDNTYLKNIKDNIPNKDYQIWENTLNDRIIDAKKLV